MGWLGEGAVVGGCGWSVRMVAVGWRVVGVLVVCPLELMGRSTFGCWFGTVGDGSWMGRLGGCQGALGHVWQRCVSLSWVC